METALAPPGSDVTGAEHDDGRGVQQAEFDVGSSPMTMAAVLPTRVPCALMTSRSGVLADGLAQGIQRERLLCVDTQPLDVLQGVLSDPPAVS